MGINTDLNVDPYYDDYDQGKQFNRVLFRPARAVQARELTQLQTILQSQVERFGSNIYKEGTIISGVNLTSRPDIFYVKLKDSRDFTDPTIYSPSETASYIVVGQVTGLRAEIVSAVGGFETLGDELKTFFLSYLNTGNAGETQFQQGEILTIRNAETDAAVGSATVASVTGHAGKSYGVSCEEGVIYQKGHFIFVNSQFIIVSKYTNVPDQVSVGFNISENLINSDQDFSLLDNASGFNNENAPGADRLQLVPTLTTYDVGEEPVDFFALMRFIDGEIVRIRDLTEFNVIGDELARRSYDQAGNYVVSGFDVLLEDTGSGVNALVQPGKAYAFGREVRNVATKRLPLEPVTSTQQKSNQVTGTHYGNYFTFVDVAGGKLEDFRIDGTRVAMYNATTLIGSLSISNIIPGKIYVYAIVKQAGQENILPTRLGGDPGDSNSGVLLSNSGKLFGFNDSGRIFDSGKKALQSTTSVTIPRRVREAASGTSITIEKDEASGIYPVLRTTAPYDVVAVDSTNLIRAVSSVTEVGGDYVVTVDQDLGVNGTIYYNARFTQVGADSISALDVYVKSVCDENTGIADLGIPNGVKLLEVVTNNGAGTNVTSKFKIVNNQRDNYYDHSYIRLKAGESLGDSGVNPENFELRIKFTALRRTSTVGNGYLTINSYSTVDKNLIPRHEGKNGIIYDLRNVYDFRPYRSPSVPYSISSSGAQVVSATSMQIEENIAPALDNQIIAQQSYYLSRVDSVVVDQFGEISIFKGAESENPSRPKLKNFYALNQISIPGNVLTIKGSQPVRKLDLSNKAYTMKDIYRIDKKIDRLIDVVSLSLLELDTKDIFIPDGSGNNRFKTGILVDSFKDLKVADLIDPEYKAAIDRTRTAITPSVLQFPIDLALSTTGTSENYQPFSDIITVGDTGTRVEVLNQQYATSFRNCVSNFYSYKGKSDIYPAFDVGYDVIENPKVDINIDITESLSDLVDNIQELSPLTVESVVSEIETTTGITNNITSQIDQTVEISELSFTETSTTTDVGNFVSSVALTPYIAEREIGIIVTGLRPNSQHYFYFEEQDVDQYVYPGALVDDGADVALNAKNVRPIGSKGDAVTADSNGVLLAVFAIPPQTFFVGENTLEIADVNVYNSISSAKTSYARATYRAYNFEIGTTELSATTRTLDFDVENSIISRQIQRPAEGDPIAQTFLVRASQAAGATVIYMSDLSLYFNKKSSTAGVTIEIREVVNGYPSQAVVPFGRKHLKSSAVNVSANGQTATVVTFDNPIKLAVEKEYCFVVIPDANNPDYLIYTSKVGEKDLFTNEAITNDWGDGVLFTSTNDRAWKSYQDEDIKFKIRRYQFQDTALTDSFVTLSPNKPEFLSVSNVQGRFQIDELAYMETGNTYTAGVTEGSKIITLSTGSSLYTQNGYILVESGSNYLLAKIISIVEDNNTTEITVDTPWGFATSTGVTSKVVVAGRITYFNYKNPNQIHLKGSSAVSNQTFTTSTLIGFSSRATATIVSVDNKEVSYVQPQILVDNTIKTFSNVVLYNLDDTDLEIIDRDIDDRGNVYLLNTLRTINSHSNIVDAAQPDVKDDFLLRVNLYNDAYQSTTPLLDADVSMLNVYQYAITDVEATSSKYISKQVILDEDFEGEGLRVYLAAYRPGGTVVDVFARFVEPTNIDVVGDWIQLTNQSPELYSNSSNTRDYREFEYTLDNEIATGFNSFQIKITMRQMSDAELEENGFGGVDGIVKGANLFPHIYDYRAIALI